MQVSFSYLPDSTIHDLKSHELPSIHHWPSVYGTDRPIFLIRKFRIIGPLRVINVLTQGQEKSRKGPAGRAQWKEESGTTEDGEFSFNHRTVQKFQLSSVSGKIGV